MERLETLVGQILDNRYHLRAVLGSGGFAVVFLADDTLLSRTVAIKMLRPFSLAIEGEGEAERDMAARLSRATFRREALTAATLSHPHIVTIHDVSPETDSPYIVMEYIDGISLSERMKQEGVLPVEETLRIAREILQALCEAHACGIIHRDIKSQNILLTGDGQVKVADFGIAQLSGSSEFDIGRRVLGSAETMSPEQTEGRVVDSRSDIYSLGILLYEMTTGYLPFTGDPATVAFMQVNEKPKYPSVLNPGIPAGLEQIIMTALEKGPENRFPDARAMLHAVEQLTAKPDRVFRRFSSARPSFSSWAMQHGTALFVGIGVAVAVLAVCGFFLFSGVEPLPAVTVVEIPYYEATRYNKNIEETLDSRITVKVRYVYDPLLSEGTVISQSIAGGTRLKLDGEWDTHILVLTVSTQQKTG